METNELFVLRDVVFVENQFPYMHKICNEQGKNGNNAVEEYLAEEELEPYCRMPEQGKCDE